jgi:hypothetical protein
MEEVDADKQVELVQEHVHSATLLVLFREERNQAGVEASRLPLH